MFAVCLPLHPLPFNESFQFRQKIFDFFLVRVPPYSENRVKIFSLPDMTIHTPLDSPCRV
jgi:hypothetical protein